MTEPNLASRHPARASVVKVIYGASSFHDPLRVVINRGLRDGVKQGQRWLVYSLDPDPIVDPETSEVLGTLELLCGTGRVIHVQERMATLESDSKKLRRRKTTKLERLATMKEWDEEEVQEPFKNVQVGSLARPM